jgi:transglutaminase-like putative cysteine protease
MFYSIRHLTKFRYTTPVSESVMETRMHPRNEGPQRCLTFHLAVSPRCRAFSYRDYLGNHVHHFDIPSQHSQLVIIAEALVDLQPPVSLPGSLPPSAWAELDALVSDGDYWEMLLPSEFDDPLTILKELNSSLYASFEYALKSTRVDSPIDDAIRTRQGVCQDFAHIMIALVRTLGIPCRYVSGYLHRRLEDHDRSAEDATHAWVEALLPQVGWVGFDPTNHLIASDRHIRTAIGRDYADVPPTKGIFRGQTASELSVAVRVTASEVPPEVDQGLPVPADWSVLVEKAQEQPKPAAPPPAQQMQQQQQ